MTGPAVWATPGEAGPQPAFVSFDVADEVALAELRAAFVAEPVNVQLGVLVCVSTSWGS